MQRQKDTHFCRITRLIFAAFLALSVILSVIGLVVAYENDTQGRRPLEVLIITGYFFLSKAPETSLIDGQTGNNKNWKNSN